MKQNQFVVWILHTNDSVFFILKLVWNIYLIYIPKNIVRSIRIESVMPLNRSYLFKKVQELISRRMVKLSNYLIRTRRRKWTILIKRRSMKARSQIRLQIRTSISFYDDNTWILLSLNRMQ